LWLHSLKVAQLLRSAACLHTNQSRSYLNHLVILHNGVKKHKLHNIHYKTLRKAGLSYGVVQAGPLCGKSSQSHKLNNMYFAIFFCHIAADGQVDLTRGFCWLCVVSGALGSYFPPLKEIEINYANCVKLQ